MQIIPAQRSAFLWMALGSLAILGAVAWAQSNEAAKLLPHGYCISGSPPLLWLHVISDALIALAYFAIPLSLVRFVRRRRDIPFGWMGMLFGLFIVACGLTHLMGVWTIWEPVYWYSGLVKAITAVASLGTAWALVRLMPLALALPSTAALRAVNQALEREITQRRQAESELKAVKQASGVELQQFASVASHDLRAPLRSVTGMLSMLQTRYGQVLDAAGLDVVRRAKRAVAQMDQLTDGLLSYARLDGEDQPKAQVDCNAVVADALMLLEVPVRESGAQVGVTPLPTVMANRQQLIRLFQNLISNAIKYCEVTPQLHISAERSDGGWTFSIQDNGIGIAPQHRERIFLMFERLHVDQSYEGTGIGLSICQRIVDGHGGRIWVEGAPKHGSIIFFTIPDKKA
jgi:signal transduction histidine kinase